MNIEEIAKASPSYIYKDGIDITSGDESLISHKPSRVMVNVWLCCVIMNVGMTKEQAEAMATKLGFSEECVDEV